MDVYYGVLAVVAGVAVVFATMLRRRTRLHGPEEEVARRLLGAVRAVREAIVALRRAVEPGPILDPDGQARGQELTYDRRLAGLRKALEDLRVETARAKMVWGSDVQDAHDALERCVDDADWATSLYLRELRRLPNNLDAEDLVRRSRVLYEMSVRPVPDESLRVLAAAVSRFERLCTERLADTG